MAAPATAPAPGGVDDAEDVATAERPLVGRGGGRQRGDRCRGGDCRHNDDDDYTNRGVGKDDTPLDNGRRKRIRRMGNDVVG